MTAKERIEKVGYEDVIVFENENYDSAFIGVSEDNRAVYDFDLMVLDLIEKYGWSVEEAVEYIEVNTLRALPYFGEKSTDCCLSDDAIERR